MLQINRESWMTREIFLNEAEKWLGKKDLCILKNTKLMDTQPSDVTNKLLKQIIYFEFQFRSELQLWRKARHQEQDYKPKTFSQTMIQEGNPLDIEKKCLLWRWQFLDELEKDHHFDLEFLILYYLKLQILDRLASFNKEKGLENFRKIVSMEKEDQQEESHQVIKNQ